MRKLVPCLCLVLFCGSASASARVALVSSENRDAVRTVLDLAAADLTADKGVELLERERIDRVLAEQSLTLSGLVAADKVVAVGKLLAVALFAVVEAAPGGKEALGLVVFDAKTGVRLHDAALPAGDLKKVAEATAQGVRAALRKHAEGLKKLRTVCVLGVRNADLPRELDTLCRSIGLILERDLVGSAGLAVLERKRLDFVNRERALPGAAPDKDLLASLVLLDVEVKRAKQGGGLAAVVFLTDSNGKQLGKVSAENNDQSAADLAAPLVKALVKELGAAPASAVPDRAREGVRFLNEGVHEWSHRDYSRGLEALESAHALDPDNAQARPLLAQYLMMDALEVLDPGRMLSQYWGTYRLKVGPAALKTALGMARRALAIRREAFARVSPRTAKSLGMFRNAYFQTHYALGYLLNKLPHVPADAYDDEANQSLQLFRAQAVRMIKDELDAWADVAESDPSAFASYTQEIERVSRDRSALAIDAASYAGLQVATARRWLEVSRRPGVKFQAWVLNRFLDDLSPKALTPFDSRYTPSARDLAQMGEVFERMAAHPNPLIALYGRFGAIEVAQLTKQLSPEEAVAAFHQVKQAAFQTIQDGRLKPADDPADDLRAGCYKFLFFAIGRLRFPNGYDQLNEYLDLCDFMLARKDVVRDVVVKVVERANVPKDSYYRKGWNVMQRAIAVADDPGHRLVEGHMGAMKAELRRAGQQILAAHPDIVPRRTTPPWERARTILDAVRLENVEKIVAPVVAGPNVYVVGSGSRKEGKFFQLIRVPLEGGPPEPLGKVAAVFEREPGPVEWAYRPSGCLGDDAFYLATRSQGIYAFPLNGDAGRRITEGLALPSKEVESVAYLDGKLYVVLVDGYLVALDPSTRQFEVLASSRRKEKRSPFDDSEAFSVPFLVADGPRHRLLFPLYQRPHYIWYAPGSVKDSTNGLWEMDVKTNAFKRHVELFWSAITWVSPLRDGHIFLSSGNNALSFDLATNRAELIWASYPPGPHLPKEKARSQQDYFPLGAPRLRRGDWLWTPSPFGRVSITENRQEVFQRPADRKENEDFVPTLLEPLPEGNLLFGDTQGLWVLEFPKGR